MATINNNYGGSGGSGHGRDDDDEKKRNNHWNYSHDDNPENEEEEEEEQEKCESDSTLNIGAAPFMSFQAYRNSTSNILPSIHEFESYEEEIDKIENDGNKLNIAHPIQMLYDMKQHRTKSKQNNNEPFTMICGYNSMLYNIKIPEILTNRIYSDGQQNIINPKIMFGTQYEVKCDETFAYYKGYVFDYDEKEEKLKISYSWRSDRSVPPNYVRPLAIPIQPNWKPKIGENIECQAKAEENEPYGWWNCINKSMKTENMYLITYVGWNDHQEILDLNMLRPYNDQEPFKDIEICRDFLAISQKRINEFKSQTSKSQRIVCQLRDIAKKTKLIHLNYCPLQEKLILIGKKQQILNAKIIIEYTLNLDDIYHSKKQQFEENLNETIAINIDQKERIKILQQQSNEDQKINIKLMQQIQDYRSEINKLNKKINMMQGKGNLICLLNMEQLNELESKLLNGISSIKKKRDKLIQNKFKCIICIINDKNISIDGCGHIVLCQQCEQKLQPKKCPICRTPYTNIKKIIF